MSLISPPVDRSKMEKTEMRHLSMPRFDDIFVGKSNLGPIARQMNADAGVNLPTIKWSTQLRGYEGEDCGEGWAGSEQKNNGAGIKN